MFSTAINSNSLDPTMSITGTGHQSASGSVATFYATAGNGSTRTMTTKLFLDSDNAAKVMGMSVRNLRKLTAVTGAIPRMRINGKQFFLARDVYDWKARRAKDLKAA